MIDYAWDFSQLETKKYFERIIIIIIIIIIHSSMGP